MKVTVGFHHTAGGDAALPRSDHGFFDDYSVVVDASTPAEAEVLGLTAMVAMVKQEHPDWPLRVIDDLCEEVWIDDTLLEFDADVWEQPFTYAATTR